jgi:beta-aspartyl-peptidase (threonine type)
MISKAIIAIHGGAGNILRTAMRPEVEAEYLDALNRTLLAGQNMLANGGSALDATTEAVRLLEDCPLFNAGHGAVFTAAGTHELDAAVMDGQTLEAGAVCCVTRLRNPVLAAYCVLKKSKHVLFAGPGAETFAVAHGLELVDPAYFHTDVRYRQWQLAREAHRTMLDHDGTTTAAKTDGANSSHEPSDPHRKFGTVGAVALDTYGHLAAATSTGGMTNRQVGRIGDTPLIGAGCYADDATCAVAATGSGEIFMRTVAAYDVAAQIKYRGVPLDEAARSVIMATLPRIGGQGGLIAVDAQGNIALSFNTTGMYRGYARVHESPVVAIYP